MGLLSFFNLVSKQDFEEQTILLQEVRDSLAAMQEQREIEKKKNHTMMQNLSNQVREISFHQAELIKQVSALQEAEASNAGEMQNLFKKGKKEFSQHKKIMEYAHLETQKEVKQLEEKEDSILNKLEEVKEKSNLMEEAIRLLYVQDLVKDAEKIINIKAGK